MSNQMNSWLAEIYGTDGADDLEKTAQAHLLYKLAAENNLDISQLSPEEMEQLAQELAAEGYDVGALAAGQQGGMPQPGMAPHAGQQMGQPPLAGRPPMQGQSPFAPAQGQPQAGGMQAHQMAPQGQAMDAGAMQKEAQAKFEEADLLGRVMAHAYTDELEKIAGHRKTASKVEAAKGALKGAAGKAANFGKNNKKSVGAAAGGAAAGFAAGRMSKKASAFEKLAEEHAAEILSATGYDPASGQDIYGQQMLQQSMGNQPQDQQGQQGVQSQQPNLQQQAQDTEQPQAEQTNQFTEALDNRALELLAQNGYDVNEILARIQMGQASQGQA